MMLSIYTIHIVQVSQAVCIMSKKEHIFVSGDNPFEFILEQNSVYLNIPIKLHGRGATESLNEVVYQSYSTGHSKVRGIILWHQFLANVISPLFMGYL